MSLFVVIVSLNVAAAADDFDALAADDSTDDVAAVSEDVALDSADNADDSDVLSADPIPTSNKDSSRIDTHFEVDYSFSRVANDFDAGERGAKFYAYLKDADGNPVVGKNVQIAVNGPIYNVTTDENGAAGLTVNLDSANTYTYALTFSGDNDYNAAPLGSTKLTVTSKPVDFAVKGTSFKVSAKTKTVTVTMKTSKNPYNGKTYLSPEKKITLKVNGKSYSAKTNSKGQVTFNVKLTKKGSYSATVSFKGDKTYSKASKKVTIKIK